MQDVRLLRKMQRDEIKEVADEVIGHHRDGAVFDYMEGLVGSDG